jgi:hypothetical protein
MERSGVYKFDSQKYTKLEWMLARVTRLGEFSPNRWVTVYFGQYFENHIKLVPYFWATFSTFKVMH